MGMDSLRTRASIDKDPRCLHHELRAGISTQASRSLNPKLKAPEVGAAHIAFNLVGREIVVSGPPRRL